MTTPTNKRASSLAEKDLATTPEPPKYSTDGLPELRDTKTPSSIEEPEPRRTGIFSSWQHAAAMEGANDLERPEAEHNLSRFQQIRNVTEKLSGMGVETRGIVPVPVEARVNTKFSAIFFIWMAANINILTFSTGALGPIAFGLGIRDTCLVILFINLLGSAFPAYFSTFGFSTGMRQMVFARFSFGYFGAMIPSILNCITFMVFLILNSILGGHALASINGMSTTVGIVIIALVTLAITFCGYRTLHIYEKYSWIPVAIVFIIALGVSAKHFSDVPDLPPPPASLVLSFAATIAGYTISWCTLAADYTIYLHHDVSKYRIFAYSYCGFLLANIPLQCLGAAFAATALSQPAWMEAYGLYSVGGLLGAAMSPLGRFGHFCVVILAFSVFATCAPTMYSLVVAFQCVTPFFTRVPRYVFAIGSTIILLPLAIVGATHFEVTLINFLGVLGYWSSCYFSILLVEHLVFRGNSTSSESYDVSAWNEVKRLPTGISAIAAFALSFALIVPCMEQIWFTGPIAKHGETGDIGFEVALGISAILYFIFRTIEVKVLGWRLGGTPKDQ